MHNVSWATNGGGYELYAAHTMCSVETPFFQKAQTSTQHRVPRAHYCTIGYKVKWYRGADVSKHEMDRWTEGPLHFRSFRAWSLEAAASLCVYLRLSPEQLNKLSGLPAIWLASRQWGDDWLRRYLRNWAALSQGPPHHLKNGDAAFQVSPQPLSCVLLSLCAVSQSTTSSDFHRETYTSHQLRKSPVKCTQLWFQPCKMFTSLGVCPKVQPVWPNRHISLQVDTSRWGEGHLTFLHSRRIFFDGVS